MSVHDEWRQFLATLLHDIGKDLAIKMISSSLELVSSGHFLSFALSFRPGHLCHENDKDEGDEENIFCSGCENDKYDNGMVLIGTNHFMIERVASVRISLSELIESGNDVLFIVDSLN